ncbi:hypothetical protein AAFF_G00066420 [Aldrovandia affinis]|uniref:DNA excision repair protein ERCC-6-like 2 n=1 Tax=Aldrovandia affinis TaxID=143900 RepID=A0AAD7WZN8_9TELE|nr:hypothetical protein AAFF_G00066420 [Aldrovandia affinis]
MATESAADEQETKWHVGDRCLAPHPREECLCEGTVQRLDHTSTGEALALVRFVCHQDEDNQEDEGLVAFSKLQKAAPSLHEKPLFHNIPSLPGASVPYSLSGDGESVPYTINRYLRDYQREGIKFIYGSYARGRGCILGDDMGLGKTIQVIAFLAATLHKTGTWQDVDNNVPRFLLSQRSSEKRRTQKVFLIVAPLSVLYNWKDELDTWGHFQSVILHGTRKDEEFARVRRGRCEIALTTYETLRLCLDQFNSINWSAVIVDEAHKIKNPNSHITQAMKAMRCKVRVGLTGTILQNNLEELWCVMDWAIPNCLGTLGHFKKQFADPIELAQKHSGTKRALATGRRAVEVLTRRLSRWFLRRTKALISSQLPKKDDRVVYCSMTAFQEAVYRAVLDSEDVSLLLRSRETCSCSSGRPRRKCCFKTNRKGVPVHSLYLSYLALLRKVANHVALLQPKGSASKKQEQYANDICEKVFQKFPDFTRRCREAAFQAMSDPMYSGKMKVLQRLLNHFLQNKDKVLLFSLSTKLLDIMESYCVAEGMEFRRLDGNTKARDRVKIVREFNSSIDINICLVSTMAGGLGLNFVGANIVVLFDPTWNPANDLQAIDRAYRIGQCRDVTVLRLISLGSVEEVMYLRQVYKQQLQSSVVGNQHARRYFEAVQGTDKGELFGIRNLFHLQTQGTCLTRQILEREGRVEVGVLTARTRSGTEESVPEERTESRPAEPGDGGEVGPGLAPGVLDFSSASEGEDGREEEGHGGRRKRCPAPAPPQLTLHQHGFSRLLQGGAGGVGSDSDTGESDDPLTTPPPTAPKETAPPHRHSWAVSSDSDGEGGHQAERDTGGRPITRETPGDGAGRGKPRAWRNGGDVTHSDRSSGSPPNRAGGLDYDTDESGDIKVLGPADRKPVAAGATARSKRSLCVPRFSATSRGKSPDIQTFTSSEDELPAKNPKHTGDHSPPWGRRDSRRVVFTALKSRGLDPPPSPNQQPLPGADVTAGTIDRLLDGVREVAYTHSNQRVVGSSKAEDRISRAALRDVFERRKYSQVAANQLLDSVELSGHTPQLSPAPEQSRKGGCDAQLVEHPVTQTLRATHHTPNATVTVGETPSAICRRQLEDMALFFKAASAHDFARDVLRGTSAWRQSRLREFYHGRNPELREVLDQMLPEPAPQPEPASAASGPSSSSRRRRRRRQPGSRRVRPPTGSGLYTEGPVQDLTEPAGEGGVEGEDLGLTSRGPLPPEDSPLHKRWSETTGPALDVAAGPSAISASGPREFGKIRQEGDPPKTTPKREGRSTPRSQKDLLTDLIGDTSVLDDLFRPRARAVDVGRPPAPPVPPVPRKSCGKDFWDILNEGDEESLNRLADPSRAERMCSRTGGAGHAKPKNDDGARLWKRNEKFLWKR